MQNFGKYLREQGVLGAEEIEQALQAQLVCGGRLGTNLVELELLAPEVLVEHLSRYSGLPVAPPAWVEHPERAALKALPLELARRRALLAMKLEPKVVHVAMLDPGDERQRREIETAVRRRVKPYVLSEVELSLALEKHLGICRDLRFVDPDRASERRRAASRGSKPEAAAAVADADAERREHARRMESLGIAPLAEDEELLDAKTFSELQTRLARAREAAQGAEPDALRSMAARDASGAAALEAAIADAEEREEIARLSLRLARLYASAVALFVVHRDVVRGFRGDGLGPGIEGIVIPVTAPSLFARPCASGLPFRGGPEDGGLLDAHLLRALGRSHVRDLLVLPVTIRGRVVNLLYADNGDEPLASTTVAALSAVCGCISAAYERVITRRKRLTE